jgi:hypothetical protein
MKKTLLVILLSILPILSSCTNQSVRFEETTQNMNELETFQMNITVTNKDNGITRTGYARVTDEYIYYSANSQVFHIVFVNGESQLITPYYHTYILQEDNTFNLKQEVPVVEFGEFTDYEFDKVNNRYIVEGTVEDFDDVDELIINTNDTFVTSVEFDSTIAGTEYNFILEFSEFDNVNQTPPTFISNSKKEEFDSYIQRIGFFGFHDNGENLGLDFNEGEVECRLSTNTCIFDTTSPIELNISDMTVSSNTLNINTPIPYQEHRPENDILQAVFEVIEFYYEQFE